MVLGVCGRMATQSFRLVFEDLLLKTRRTTRLLGGKRFVVDSCLSLLPWLSALTRYLTLLAYCRDELRVVRPGCEPYSMHVPSSAAAATPACLRSASRLSFLKSREDASVMVVGW